MTAGARSADASRQGRDERVLRCESLADLAALWAAGDSPLRWPIPFVLPCWLDAWWRSFGAGQALILALHRRGAPLGVAPLRIAGATAHLMGDDDLCDYRDVVCAPGAGAHLMAALRRELAARGVARLELAGLRPDAIAWTEMIPEAQRLGLAVSCQERECSQEMPLPATFEAYLAGLEGKQRHELRRKLRRLEADGAIRFRTVGGGEELPELIERFLAFFRSSRADKRAFMTPAMGDYFRALAHGLAAARLLRLGVLELGGAVAAMVFCFRLGGTVYLYNNAFDERLRQLSVGLLSKVLSIREAIAAGALRYDFLKGGEHYKRQLGGRPTAIRDCIVALSDPAGSAGQGGGR